MKNGHYEGLSWLVKQNPDGISGGKVIRGIPRVFDEPDRWEDFLNDLKAAMSRPRVKREANE